MPHDSTNKRDPAILEELAGVVALVKAGDASLLPRLRAILDSNPEIIKYVGDLERIVTRCWAEALGQGDPLALEAVQRQAVALRAELEGEAPTRIEKLLIGNIVATWLEVCYSQLQASGTGERTATQANINSKRADSALKRHLAAVKTLTTVRALMPKGLVPVSRLKLFAPEARSG